MIFRLVKILFPHRAGIALGIVVAAAASSFAYLGNNSQENESEFAASASTQTWSSGPSGSYRLFVDVYNLTDFYDSEPGRDKDRFPAKTLLSDTARPVVTLLWDKRFRFQAGVIAQRTYGREPGIGSVDPWLQMLWKPTPAVSAVFGNLSIPHDYLPAIKYHEDYFLNDNNEKGMQVLHRREGWTDDLFFNYRQSETAERQEKFDLGYVHHNEWKWFNFTYQAHFTHTGGDNFPHTYNTISDSAQTGGAGLKFHPFANFIWGGSYSYLHSHFRTDAGPDTALSRQVNGDGHLVEGFIRWSRLRVTFGDWHNSNYSHEGGDPYYIVPVMQFLEAHWDFVVAEDFKLFGEITGYFLGNNNNGFSHYVKPTFWIEAAWHFSIPSKGWALGALEEEKDEEPARWDNDI